MSTKFLLLFLSTFLLVQSSIGKALPSTEGSIILKRDTLYVPEPPGIKIVLYVVSEFSELADIYLNTGKKLFEDVVADISATDNKNEQTIARLEDYSKMLKNMEKLKTADDSDEFTNKFELMVELSDLLDKSNATLIEEPTSTDKIFDASLKKHGLSNLEQQLEEKFEVFAKEFNETTEKVLNSTTIEQWPEKPKIQDWLLSFKAENDAEKKIALFGKFFEFFE